MGFLSLFRRSPRLTEAQVAELCSRFQSELEHLASSITPETSLRDQTLYLGGGMFHTTQIDDAPISPIAEANVYLAYKKWDCAVSAVERGLSLSEDKLAMSNVDRPHEVINNLLMRMKEAASNLSSAA